MASQERTDLIVIAASNRVDGLDAVLLRPGWFRPSGGVSPPDLKGGERDPAVHTRNKPVEGVDLGMVARRTSGLRRSRPRQHLQRGAIFAGREGRVDDPPSDFDGALERGHRRPPDKRVIQPAEKRVIADHEAGHALLRSRRRRCRLVHKISIIPRGLTLGYTLNVPDQDRT